MNEITKEDALRTLFEAHPPYKEQFEKNRDSYYSEDGELLLYVVASDIADEVLRLHANGDRSSLKRVFDFIEALEERGDEYCKELATIGFLEDIQMHPDITDATAEYLASLLGVRSKKSLDDLNDFWSGRTPLVGVTWEELAKEGLSERGISAPTELQVNQEIVKQMRKQVRAMNGGALTGAELLIGILFGTAGLVIFLVVFALLLPH
jgi:hypothetical protein